MSHSEFWQSLLTPSPACFPLYCCPHEEIFLENGYFFLLTSPHHPFTFSWETGLIGTNCSATTKPAVLPVASGRKCAASAGSCSVGNKGPRARGALVPELYFSLAASHYLNHVWFKLSQGQRAGEIKRRGFCSTWVHPSIFLFLCPGLCWAFSRWGKRSPSPLLFKAWC